MRSRSRAAALAFGCALSSALDLRAADGQANLPGPAAESGETESGETESGEATKPPGALESTPPDPTLPLTLAPPDPSMPWADEAPPPGPRAYTKALRRWTQELKLYSLFETKLLMRAVFKSRPFRTSWAHEIARTHELPSEDYGTLRAREADDATRFHELLLAVWADDSLGGDFEGANAAWSLRLIAEDGRTAAPLVLTRIKRPNTQILTMFPFITPHDRVFVVKFPVLGDDGEPLLPGDASVLRVRVAGVQARGELAFPLRAPAPR